ncbi:MAG: hypothetical protein AAFR84_03030 [Pseudomonadota bacterium]
MTRSDLAKMAGCPTSFLNHAAAQDVLEFAILTRANETQPHHTYDAEAVPAIRTAYGLTRHGIHSAKALMVARKKPAAAAAILQVLNAAEVDVRAEEAA